LDVDRFKGDGIDTTN